MRRGILAILIVTFIISSCAYSQADFKSRLITLKRTIELNHYSPRPVNDSFSVALFNRFVKHLNSHIDSVELSDAQQKRLSTYQLQLDDELNGRGWQFLDTITEYYRSALIKADKGSGATHRSIRRALDYPRGYKEYVANIYAEVIANCFDPHTEFMPKEEKEAFESELSTQGYYFGFALEKNDSNQVQIARVMPGSPAWKSGDLNTGDVIVSIGWEGKTPLMMNETRPEEVSQMLAIPGNQKLALTVRKANGIHKTTFLTKEKMDNEDNNVRGFVLKGTKTIGYIYLPDFYTRQQGSGGSSANDVAKAIIKLKKDNIEGLILDVRYNGGGSLLEAIDMAGIFLDYGPVGMLREKSGNTITLKDANRGTIYNGPLAVMINGQSASASEFIAAVLQNYNRAVVVGSNTFGKGSAQQIFQVDTTGLPGNNTDNGFVKITTGKFYRVDGTTTQYAGVKPDIVLPDIFDALNYHEAAMPFALPADSIAPNSMYKPMASLPVQLLSQKSAARVTASQHFAAVKKQIAAITGNIKEEKEARLTPSAVLKADINTFDASLVNGNDYLSSLNERWKSKINSDIYIEETFNILLDVLTINNHKP
jgi:carboxyl-terminal processing protease